MPGPTKLDKFASAKITYNYCGICGRRPNEKDEPNRTPLRWWDPDDGWKIGSLCSWCWDDVAGDVPKDEDYAMAVASARAAPPIGSTRREHPNRSPGGSRRADDAQEHRPDAADVGAAGPQGRDEGRKR